MKVIVYADFNCVYCFLASQRADRLTREGIAEIDWRAVEHLPRLPVTGYKPRPGEAQPGGEAGEGDLAEAAELALPGERLPAGPPSAISNTRAAVSAYAEAIADGIQDQLRLRLFESIWAQGRNMSSAYDVRRVVAALLWPADTIYPHLVSPDLPAPVLHDPDPMRIVRREGGAITPDGGPLTTAAYHRARQWRQQWLALFEPALPELAIPAVIGPDGAVHVGPDGLRCLAGIVGPDALSWRAAPGYSSGMRSAASAGPSGSMTAGSLIRRRRRPSGAVTGRADRDPAGLWQRPYVAAANHTEQALARLIPAELSAGLGSGIDADWLDPMLSRYYAAWPFAGVRTGAAPAGSATHGWRPGG